VRQVTASHERCSALVSGIKKYDGGLTRLRHANIGSLWQIESRSNSVWQSTGVFTARHQTAAVAVLQWQVRQTAWNSLSDDLHDHDVTIANFRRTVKAVANHRP